MLSFAKKSNGTPTPKSIEKKIKDRSDVKENIAPTKNVRTIVSASMSKDDNKNNNNINNTKMKVDRISHLEEELEHFNIKFVEQEEELIKKNQELRRLRKLIDNGGSSQEACMSPTSVNAIRNNLNTLETQNDELQTEMRTLNAENRRLFQELHLARASLDEKAKDLRDRERALGLLQRHFGEFSTKSIGSGVEQMIDAFQQMEEKLDRLRQEQLNASKDVRSRAMQAEKEVERLLKEEAGQSIRLKRAEEQVQELKNELNTSRKEVSCLQREKEMQSDALIRAQEEVQEYRTASTKETERLREELERITEALLRSQEEFHEMKGEVSRETAGYRREAEIANESLQEAEEQISHLRLQMAEARKETERLDGEREARSDRLKHLEAQLMEFKKLAKQDSDRLRSELDDRDKEVSKLNELLAEANREQARRQRDFEVEVVQARSDADRLAREAYAKTERVKELEEQIADIRLQLLESRREIEESRLDAEQALERSKRAEEEAACLQSELGDLSRDIKRAHRDSETNVETLKRELSVACDRLKRTESELIALRSSSERDLVRLQRDVELKSERIKNLEERIQEMSSTISDESKDMLKLRRENEAAKDKLKKMEEHYLEEKAALQKDLFRIRKELEDKTKAIEKTESMWLMEQTETKHEANRVKKEMELLKRSEAKVAEVEKEALRLQREETRLLIQIGDLQNELMEAKKETLHAKKDREAIAEALRRTETEIGESATVQVELDRLRREVTERTEQVVRTEKRLLENDKDIVVLRREIERLQRIETEFMDLRMQLMDTQMEADRLKREVLSKTERLQRTEEELYDCDTAIAAEKQAVIERLQNELAQSEGYSLKYKNSSQPINEMEQTIAKVISKLSALLRERQDNVANPWNYDNVSDHLIALSDFIYLERMGLYDELVKFSSVLTKHTGIDLQKTDPGEALGPQLKVLRRAISDVFARDVSQSNAIAFNNGVVVKQKKKQVLNDGLELENERSGPAPQPTPLFEKTPSPVKSKNEIASSKPSSNNNSGNSVVRIKSIENPKSSRSWRVMPLQSNPQPQARPVKPAAGDASKRSKSGNRIIAY